MGIFNVQAVSPWEANTRNRENAPAFEITDARYKLASLLLTSFVKDQFYRSKDQERTELRTLLTQVDPLFAAKAALYARNEFGMRSISHVVAGELAVKLHKTQTAWARSFFKRIMRRPDDGLEILSYFASITGQDAGKKIKRVPNFLRGGFAARLVEFDEYQLEKYRNEDKQLSLIDLMRICHPKYTPALEKLMKGTLTSENRFEGAVAESGRKEKAMAAEGASEEQIKGVRAESWGKLLVKGKGGIGYMALLKNLRNISTDAPQYLGQALTLLQDADLIRKSLVLPFRYYTAYKELQEAQVPQLRMILPALAAACDIALSNVPRFPGRTLIALDKSRSMQGRMELASQFAAVLYKANDADLMLFDTMAGYLAPSPSEATLTLQQTILHNIREMGGTSFPAVFQAAARHFSKGSAYEIQARYDRVIFISDDQSWHKQNDGNYQAMTPAEAYRQYCRETATRPAIYLIDTAGLGTMSFPEDKVYAVAGFSEKIFDLMSILEEDRSALVNRIESVEV